MPQVGRGGNNMKGGEGCRCGRGRGGDGEGGEGACLGAVTLRWGGRAHDGMRPVSVKARGG